VGGEGTRKGERKLVKGGVDKGRGKGNQKGGANTKEDFVNRKKKIQHWDWR